MAGELTHTHGTKEKDPRGASSLSLIKQRFFSLKRSSQASNCCNYSNQKSIQPPSYFLTSQLIQPCSNSGGLDANAAPTRLVPATASSNHRLPPSQLGRVNSPRYSVRLILYSRPVPVLIPYSRPVPVPDPPGVHGSQRKGPWCWLIYLYPQRLKGTDSRQPPPFCEFLRADKEALLKITGAGGVPWRCWGLSDYCIVPASMALEWELCEYTVSLDCKGRLLLMAEWRSAD